MDTTRYKMRSPQHNILIAVATLSLVAPHHLGAQKTATVGIVDFYGLRQIAERQGTDRHYR